MCARARLAYIGGMIRPSSLLLALIAATPGLADDGPGPHAAVDILPGWRLADGTHMAALRITLDAGWKTYWRAPGEAGIPPSFDWSGSDNLAGVDVHWPVPEVIASDGMTTLGFTRELILPIEVTPVDPAADIALTGSLAFGICHDICMPVTSEVNAALPALATAEVAAISAALDARPATATEANVAAARCAVTEIADGLRVTAEFEMPMLGEGEYSVFEPTDPTIWVSESVTRREGGVLVAEADLVPPQAKPFALDTATLRFTVLADGRGVDILGCDAAR